MNSNFAESCSNLTACFFTGNLDCLVVLDLPITTDDLPARELQSVWLIERLLDIGQRGASCTPDMRYVQPMQLSVQHFPKKLTFGNPISI